MIFTDAKVVEAKKKSYMQQNSSTFSQLVADVKARRDSKKSTQANLKSSCNSRVSSTEDVIVDPREGALENVEERLKVGSAVSSSGLKRTAGNHSINSSGDKCLPGFVIVSKLADGYKRKCCVANFSQDF